MGRDRLFLSPGVQTFPSSGVRTDIMLSIEQVRRLSDGEPEVAELLREFEEVDRYYREAVAAMNVLENEVAPVLNSAEVTISVQPTFVTLDLTHDER